jgi:hypothetical protein
MKITFYLALDDDEHSIIIRSLNGLRNRLMAQGKYTDGVDDVLVKAISAKKKKLKIIYAEV